MRTWLRNHPRAITLIWAYVWLVFTLFPITDALAQPMGWRRWCALATCTLFIGAIVRSWLVYPAMPPNEYRAPAGFFATVAVICACQFAFVVFGGVQNMQMLIFAAAVIGMQLAPAQFLYGVAALVGFLAAESAWLVGRMGADRTVVTVTVIQIVIMLAMFFSLAQVFSSHRKLALANETIRQLTRITERERISADLHDIVGQSLTALSLKAQLTGKLLDKEAPNAAEQARQQLYEMQKLSQEALADVRRVVRDARRLTVAEEISAARELLKTAEIRLVVVGDPLQVDDDAERTAAHVVREAAANVVHHSVAATRCTIRTWSQGVRISDNSRVLPGPAREAPTEGGSGLAALEERVRGAGGTLRYGRTKSGWQVEAVFSSAEAHGPSAATEDTTEIHGGDWAMPTAVT